MINTIW